MKDKEYRKQKKRIDRFIEKWKAFLGLRWWSVTINYHDEPYIGEATVPTAARTTTYWEYNRAVIDFYVPEFTTESDERVEEIVIHEFCHILVNEMRQWHDANDGVPHEERVVSNLAQAFLWVRDAAKNGSL